MTLSRVCADAVSKSTLKLSLPEDEQLAHFRFMGTIRTSFGLTPTRRAHRCTSALKALADTGVSSRSMGRFPLLIPMTP